MADSDWLLVAAIDFGTTYSGYAFSFRYDPNVIHTPQIWYAGTTPLASLKTPSCLLLNPEKTLNSFGYEAQDRYANLAEEESHREYFYFENFKMALHHNETVTRNTTVDDILGKTLPAIDVFSMSIEYMKNHLMKTLQDRLPDATVSDIKFVLTVPAIWRDSAKEFMCEAAVRAGIKSDKLVLALEPEAASIFCQKLPVEKLPRSEGFDKVGTQYLVADIGGGTGDFTVHEKLENKKLKELSKASGGAYGGINVDKKFLQFISNVMGAKALQQLKSEEMSDYLDLVRDFEIKKRTVTNDSIKSYVVRLSTSFMQFASQTNPNYQDMFEKDEVKGRVKFLRDKLKFDSSLMESFFTESIEKITTHIEVILKHFPKVKFILLVGGYGECVILQNRIRNCFPQKYVIVPHECGLAVVKGAVLFGHDLKIISERILRYTYGENLEAVFDPAIHSEDRKYVDDYGVTRCKGTFNELIKAGQRITSDGRKVSTTVVALTKNQKNISLKLYYTKQSSILYLNDDCRFLGTVSIPLTGDKETDRECEVSFTFGLTKIYCEVTEKSSGKKTEATFDLLK